MKKLEKEQYRQQVLLKRTQYDWNAIDSSKLQQSIEYIIEKNQIKNILGYFPLAGEPDIKLLYNNLFENKFSLYFPFIESSGEMIYYKISSLEELKKQPPYHIPSPVDHQRSKDYQYKGENNSMVIIPGVAFDIHKNRLGFGQGFFDKFLCSFEGLKVGVSYHQFIYPSIPFEEHDVKMDILLSEIDQWG